LQADIATLTKIIVNYPEVFEINDVEMQKEAKLLQMLEKLQAAPPQNSSAGDLKIWLTLGEATSSETTQISVCFSPYLKAPNLNY
jgi:hypothetical protein